MKWHSETKQISDLKLWDENPRKLTEKGLADLKKSIDRFGVAEPVVVNLDGSVIGGHGRLKVLSESGVTEVDCYVPDKRLTKKQAEELGVRLNKNIAGEWDWDKLNEWPEEELKDWGFEEWELSTPDIPTDNKEIDESAMAQTEHECPKCGFKW